MHPATKLLSTALVLGLPLAAIAQATPEPASPSTAPSQTQKAPEAPGAPASTPAPKPPFAVTIYGTLNVNLQTTQATGATASAADVDRREAVSTDSSNIGFRGTLALTPALGATFQCETQVNVDGISPIGLCNRNSRVGITGAAWGTLWYGNWDTPLKGAAYGTKADDPFGNTDVYGFQSIMGSPGFNYRSSAWKTEAGTKIAGFDVRASNSVGYHSAKWNGLSVKAQYSVREFSTANGDVQPQLWGAAVNYDVGGLSVYGAVEQHLDAYSLSAINGTATSATFGATAANPAFNAETSPKASSKDFAWRVGAGYELKAGPGATTVMAAVEQLQLKQDGTVPVGALDEYKRLAWQVGVRERIGPHELRARFSMADAGDCTINGGGTCSTTDFGASMYTLGYAYFFTPSLQTYLYYTQIMNEDNAQYTFSIGGAPAVAGSTPKGADPQALGLGIRWAF